MDRRAVLALVDGAPRTRTAIVVDSNEHYRAGISELLATLPRCEVIATGRTLQDAAVLVARHRPDLLIVEAGPRLGPALRMLREALAVQPELSVVALTDSSDARSTQRLVTAGAVACLVRDAELIELAASVSRAARGEGTVLVPVSPARLARLAREQVALGSRESQPGSGVPWPAHDVVQLLGSPPAGDSRPRLRRALSLGLGLSRRPHRTSTDPGPDSVPGSLPSEQRRGCRGHALVRRPRPRSRRRR